jgi:long-chain acyl-CoA synthetase
VEGVLLAHPGVLEAAVKGVPAAGPRRALGEMVQAYVVARDPAPTERDLRGFCFERLASFKVPARIVFLGALPRNPAGKVVKAEL